MLFRDIRHTIFLEKKLKYSNNGKKNLAGLSHLLGLYSYVCIRLTYSVYFITIFFMVQ